MIAVFASFVIVVDSWLAPSTGTPPNASETGSGDSPLQTIRILSYAMSKWKMLICIS